MPNILLVEDDAALSELIASYLERNGYHLNPDTAWRVAHQACVGGLPGYIGLEMAAQGIIGPGAQERVMDVARKYACPVQ